MTPTDRLIIMLTTAAEHLTPTTLLFIIRQRNVYRGTDRPTVFITIKTLFMISKTFKVLI